MIFEVLSEDVAGKPACCSYCDRGATSVVVLPLTEQAGLEERLPDVDGGQRWLGLCAYCVLDMARALQKAGGKGT